MIVFNHNTMANAVFSNNNMANFYNNFVKAFDTSSTLHTTEICFEPFNCRGNCFNAFNGMTFSSGDSSDIHIDTLDLSGVTWAKNMYRHVSGYDGADIYVNNLILNYSNIYDPSRVNTGFDNMFNGLSCLHVNELRIEGYEYDEGKLRNCKQCFNTVSCDHVYFPASSIAGSYNFRQQGAADMRDWRYCLMEDGGDGFYGRDFDETRLDSEFKMGTAHISVDKSMEGGWITFKEPDGDSYNYIGLFWISGPNLFSIDNRTSPCMTNRLGECPYDGYYMFNTPNMIWPACTFDDLNRWNDPDGVEIRSTIPELPEDMDDYYRIDEDPYEYRRYVDFSPVCGITTKTMQNAYRDCRGITSLSAVCGPNVTSMRYAYADCCNLKIAACGPNVTDMSYAYRGCTNLTTAVCGPNVTDMRNAYYECPTIKEAACGRNVEYMDNAYRGCTSIKTAAVGSKVFSMSYAYAGCTALTTACDGVGVGFMENAYLGCTSLTKFVSHVSPQKDLWWDIWGSKCGIPKELWDTMEYEYIP